MSLAYSILKFLFILSFLGSISFYNSQTYTLSQLDSINREFWNKGELEAAATFNFQALKEYKKQDNDEGIIATYINIANAFSYLNKNKEGLEYLDKARKKIRKTDNPLLHASLYGQYGNSYSLLGLYHQSNKNFNKAIYYLKQVRNHDRKEKNMYVANTWKIYNFNKLGETDSANIIQYKNLRLFPDNPLLYENIATGYILKKIHLDSAEYYLNKALPLIEKDNIFIKSRILLSFGNLYMAKNDFKKASEYYLRSLSLNKKIKNKYHEKIINLKLSKAYKAMGNTEKSTEHFYNYSILNNEIQTNEKKVVSLMIEKFLKEKEDEEKTKKRSSIFLLLQLPLFS